MAFSGYPVSAWLHSLLERLLPPRCIICDAPGHGGMDICPQCLAGLPHNPRACSQCALPLPSGDVDTPVRCGQCLKKPPAFDHAISLFEYKDDAASLIMQLKFHDRLALSRLFGQLMLDRVRVEGATGVDALLPVPLHRSRLRSRGFNQSVELARMLSRGLQIPLLRHQVARVVATSQQTGLDAKTRRQNIRGAFRVMAAIPYEHVAIVDDVVTTGSTVNELARVLKKAGVKTVSVWSVARAPSPK